MEATRGYHGSSHTIEDNKQIISDEKTRYWMAEEMLILTKTKQTISLGSGVNLK